MVSSRVDLSLITVHDFSINGDRGSGGTRIGGGGNGEDSSRELVLHGTRDHSGSGVEHETVGQSRFDRPSSSNTLIGGSEGITSFLQRNQNGILSAVHDVGRGRRHARINNLGVKSSSLTATTFISNVQGVLASHDGIRSRIRSTETILSRAHGHSRMSTHVDFSKLHSLEVESPNLQSVSAVSLAGVGQIILFNLSIGSEANAGLISNHIPTDGVDTSNVRDGSHIVSTVELEIVRTTIRHRSGHELDIVHKGSTAVVEGVHEVQMLISRSIDITIRSRRHGVELCICITIESILSSFLPTSIAKTRVTPPMLTRDGVEIILIAKEGDGESKVIHSSSSLSVSFNTHQIVSSSHIDPSESNSSLEGNGTISLLSRLSGMSQRTSRKSVSSGFNTIEVNGISSTSGNSVFDGSIGLNTGDVEGSAIVSRDSLRSRNGGKRSSRPGIHERLGIPSSTRLSGTHVVSPLGSFRNSSLRGC